MSKKDKVIFLVGEDITSHLILNGAIQATRNAGLDVVVYYAKHKVTKNAAQPELKEFALHDRLLLNEVVYPYIDSAPATGAPNMSPKQLADHYGYEMDYIDDMNSPEFVEMMKQRDDIFFVLSNRSTHIFYDPLVKAINKDSPYGKFFNLHSGILPDYRGVMPTMRTMFDYASGKRSLPPVFGLTLHKVDSYDKSKKDNGIDTGNVIDVATFQDMKVGTGFGTQIKLAPWGVKVITKLIERLKDGDQALGTPQIEDKSGYYTFPTKAELKEWKNSGVLLFNERETVSTLVRAFTLAGSAEELELETSLKEKLAEWHKTTGICTHADAQKPTQRLIPRTAANGNGSPTASLVIPTAAAP
ncbi:MAG: hypothetical protein RBR86_05580 [Pseudobdellovibrionaceae bacterium]|jgi:methionyl-tRNA formyltransferase|nr:hypothetical protein [Pseudobdellovibrionaceae bacterium]